MKSIFNRFTDHKTRAKLNENHCKALRLCDFILFFEGLKNQIVYFVQKMCTPSKNYVLNVQNKNAKVPEMNSE